MKAIRHNKRLGFASTKASCELFSVHRDAHYRYLKRFNEKQAQHRVIIEFVKKERSVQPRFQCNIFRYPFIFSWYSIW